MTPCPTCQQNPVWCKCPAKPAAIGISMPSVESTPIPIDSTDSSESKADEMDAPVIPPEVGAPRYAGAVNSLILQGCAIKPAEIESTLRSHLGMEFRLIEEDRDAWKRKYEDAEARIEKIRHALNTAGSEQ